MGPHKIFSPNVAPQTLKSNAKKACTLGERVSTQIPPQINGMNARVAFPGGCVFFCLMSFFLCVINLWKTQRKIEHALKTYSKANNYLYIGEVRRETPYQKHLASEGVRGIVIH